MFNPNFPTLIVIFFASSLGSQVAPAATTCSEGDLIRVVNVVYSEPGSPVPCEVLYEKPAEGMSMTLWRAQNEAGFCEAQAQAFVDKMTMLGWTCEGEPANVVVHSEEETH